MFQLEDRQLHMIAGMIAGVSMILFVIFSIGSRTVFSLEGSLKGMEDFSEGWISTYESSEAKNPKKKTVSEVVSLPAELPVKKGTAVWLTHKVPDMDREAAYLVLETNRQAVRVNVDNEEIYRSTSFDDKIKVCHVIPVSPQFADRVITLSLTGEKDKMQISGIRSGSFNELLVEALSDNGMSVAAGAFLFLLSLSLFAAWFIIANQKRKKRVLVYAGLEALSVGVLLLVDSRLMQYLWQNHFVAYLVRNCLLILSVVFHLMVIRCFMNKKRVLLIVDIGIMAYGIFYISIMVLQAFGLFNFAGTYTAGRAAVKLGIFLYTAVLAVAVYQYKRKEAVPIFYANAALLLCLVLRQVLVWAKLPEAVSGSAEPLGFGLYFMILWVFALKLAVKVKMPETESVREERLRAWLVEQLNPSLLFAAFQSLQQMIKKGSGESVRMVYYISVYVRNNLKAVEHAGEIISFEEELEHMLSYLKLQKAKNQAMDFTVECKIRDFKVPRHSLEPMVENAVKYGIAGRDNRGNVALRSYKRADGYAVQIVDDGIGFDKRILKKKSPTALLNLFALLEQQCRAKTEVVTKEGKGTVITVVFPELENELMEQAE
ncbi:MAG: histidine kinase [Bacteroidales bacterium]|nr:histidine kinase [Clostridium sp.]MCM1203220.1 histidine kinase [Bacteroidales bacterium]